MNETETKISNIIGLVVALGFFILSIIYETGFMIFILTLCPIFLMSRGLSTLVIDITMLILLIIFSIVVVTGAGEITETNQLFIFCPLTGYLLWRYLKS